MKNTDYPRGLIASNIQLRNEALTRLARGRRPDVSDKVRSIVEQPPQSFQQLPFLREGAELPLQVARSFFERKHQLWGRY